MTLPRFTSKYPRPLELTDPHDDHSFEYLRDLLAIPDEQMGVREFMCIFQTHCPAADYEEGVYFLPMAFDHAIRHTEDGFEFIDGIVNFVSRHRDQLQADGLFDAACDLIRSGIETLTTTFKIEPYGVENASFVYVAIEALVNFGLPEIAETIVANLACQVDQPIKSAWFVEFAADVWSEGTLRNNEAVLSMTADADLLRRHIAVVQQHWCRSEMESLHWSRRIKQLGM